MAGACRPAAEGQYSAAVRGRNRPRRGAGNAGTQRGPLAQATALTMSSTTFLASPNTIIVLSM